MCHDTLPGSLRAPLGERDALVGDALRFFGFGVCGEDGFVLEQGRHKVAEEGYSVRAVAPKVPVFELCTGHGGLFRGSIAGGMGGGGQSGGRNIMGGCLEGQEDLGKLFF